MRVGRGANRLIDLPGLHASVLVSAQSRAAEPEQLPERSLRKAVRIVGISNLGSGKKALTLPIRLVRAAQIGAFDPLVPDAPSALRAGEHHLVDIDPGIANFQMLGPRLLARRNLARASGAIGFENLVHDRPPFRG